jgi:phenylacetate-CoA ligase
VCPSDIGGVFSPVDTGVMAHTMMWEFNTMGCGYVNCPEPSPENIIDTIQNVPVTLVATRPSVVCSIMGNPAYERIARQSEVRMLLLGGSFLTNGRRHLIEQMWGAECYGMFGMSEVFGPMAGECRIQNGYHYLDKYLLIEIVDPVTHQPVKPGQFGVAIYTTLWNKGFPLLRYWTDDIIAVDTTPCGCGSDLPRLHYRGRLADSLNIHGSYVFPSMLEECLFSHRYYGEYRAVQGERIKVILEKTEGFDVNAELKQEIDQLFMSEVMIQYADKEQLLYDGHGIRFTKEDQSGSVAD